MRTDVFTGITVVVRADGRRSECRARRTDKTAGKRFRANLFLSKNPPRNVSAPPVLRACNGHARPAGEGERSRRRERTDRVWYIAAGRMSARVCLGRGALLNLSRRGKTAASAARYNLCAPSPDYIIIIIIIILRAGGSREGRSASTAGWVIYENSCLVYGAETTGEVDARTCARPRAIFRL